MTHPSDHTDSLRTIETQLAQCLEMADALEEFVVAAFICSAHQTTLTRLNDIFRGMTSGTTNRA